MATILSKLVEKLGRGFMGVFVVRGQASASSTTTTGEYSQSAAVLPEGVLVRTFSSPQATFVQVAKIEIGKPLDFRTTVFRQNTPSGEESDNTQGGV